MRNDRAAITSRLVEIERKPLWPTHVYPSGMGCMGLEILKTFMRSKHIVAGLQATKCEIPVYSCSVVVLLQSSFPERSVLL